MDNQQNSQIKLVALRALVEILQELSNEQPETMNRQELISLVMNKIEERYIDEERIFSKTTEETRHPDARNSSITLKDPKSAH
jgi:hypothetical protein